MFFIKQANQGVKAFFVFVNRLCQHREEREAKKWIDRVSGEEINIMSDISKSWMHESTMPPMAQQTNSWIKERLGGKLQERSKLLYYKNKKSWSKRKARVKGRNVSLLCYSFIDIVKCFPFFLCLLSSLKELDCHFFLHFTPFFSFFTPGEKVLFWAKVLMSARQGSGWLGSAMLRHAYVFVLLQSKAQSHSSNQGSG